MRVRRFSVLSALALAVCARPVWAFLDPPYLSPANPTAGEMVFVNIYGGECDLVDYGITWPPPVTQQGNQLTILFTGVHEDDPEFCYYGIGTSTHPVGTFLPGAYTLDVERRYGNPFGSWTQETLGIIPFTVSGGPSQRAVEAPTLSGAGVGFLLLALIAAMLLNLRKHLA